jgi:hypothetical protein
MLSSLPLLLAVTAGQWLPPWMTNESRPEDLAVTLVTFGPGDDLVSWWGHTSLAVEDRRLGQARLYNYGMFSFDEGFFGRFFKGRLEFWVSDRDPVDLTYRYYQSANRDVRLQELDLPSEQAMQLAKALGENVLPKNRMYLYHHYRDNCSTRPRDLVDQATWGQLKAATSGPARMSLRDHTLRYARVSPPIALGLDFLQNDELDQPITQQAEAYLPDELERQVQALVVTRPDGSRAPLVKRQVELFKSNRPPPPERAPNWNWALLGLGVVVGFAGLGLGHLGRAGARWPRVLLGLLTALFGLVLGILGTGLLVMGLFTDHSVTHRNENLFLANPITLALLPLGLMLVFGSKRARTGLLWTWSALGLLSILGMVLKVLPAFDQANWNLIALLAPINLSFAAAHWMERQRSTRAGPPLNEPST